MNKKKNPTHKDLIFRRYIGQFLQATEPDATHRKSSEEIAFELSGMAYFSIDEISIQMISFGYQIGFDDAKPVWLMKENRTTQITE
ncbi:hypothetical protein D0T84_16225 [Dysgonomonas sp. 521]|uniref:hypothetical protein n=1 Tax=Dysgonomonas sp. 521 TaxID=2302932 RepID=UPI0013D84249|nr:hypothetical protein [Dysgonomonas sp. 521]NDV96448.1 hypothetical protein [Dysgonomonas sp. 521]